MTQYLHRQSRSTKQFSRHDKNVLGDIILLVPSYEDKSLLQYDEFILQPHTNFKQFESYNDLGIL